MFLHFRSVSHLASPVADVDSLFVGASVDAIILKTEDDLMLHTQLVLL